MKKLGLFLILMIPFGVFAQEFAPIGAIWHYSQSSWIFPDLITYKTIESVSDTSIDGKECKKLVEVERLFEDTVAVYSHYLCLENDSVLFFKDNSFYVLYDFGAVAGDTIILDYYHTSDDSPLQMIIDSTGIIDINGLQRKIQYITCGDGLSIEFGGPVIEGIGSTFFLFPTYDGTINGPLRCYQDEALGLYINLFYSNYGWDYENCDQIITDIEEEALTNPVLVYPNPFMNYILIKNTDPDVEFRIINSIGNLLKTGKLDLSGEIKTDELTRGIYFLVLKSENNVTVKKIVKN